MTLISTTNTEINSLSIEFGFYNKLQNVDTKLNIVTIVSDKKIDVLPVIKNTGVTFSTEKQIVETTR